MSIKCIGMGTKEGIEAGGEGNERGAVMMDRLAAEGRPLLTEIVWERLLFVGLATLPLASAADALIVEEDDGGGEEAPPSPFLEDKAIARSLRLIGRR